ncbi:glycosyltransferase family 2 protein [Aquiflexum sp. LQ15W]|uniref:glycosyltransferase family 2 protein n=1 Tax=Cognataquiflexum nitidum TaxID=2922272 RepID=UPI001F131753|nr:glycosyltransferase family 2 protein [Cognataquiflexum nitidum]MCH6201346.1 glycosyltransferase family 2 protein [Cognataquiflexum nitidum]
MQLAIVIPAYKATFLAATLQSLAEQQVQDFHVYIGDDASPEAIADIVTPFQHRLSITYKRFDINEGGKDLTRHWKRCIDMVKGEPWIWLLPDDDVATLECVAVFLQTALADSEHRKLYRFQTSHINTKGELLFNTTTCPPLESNAAFLLNKLRFKRSSSVAEYIFSRKKYNSVGCFTSLPLAWGSDDWLWIQLSQEDDIVTLPAGRVLLRQSNLNISANTQDYTQQKFEAKYRFFDLLFADKQLLKKIEKLVSKAELMKTITEHLFFEYRSYKLSFLNKNLFFFAKRNNQVLGGGILKNIYRLIRYQISSL